MDYRKHYNSLVERARKREKDPGTYCELHHILMKSEGGTNEESNLVWLSAREHFVAHWLLFREKPESYVRAEAFRMMCDVDPSLDKLRYIPSGRVVAEAREASARLKSELYKKKCWVKKDGTHKNIFREELEIYLELGWERGKNYSHSPETREKLRQSRLNEAPRGPQFYQKMSQIVKERYKNNPESWKKSKETRKKLSGLSKQKWESEEFRARFRETRSKSRVKCPHCVKEGNFNIMQRWHFDNCKHNPQKNEK
ncbi:MAG TPA: HNH endonuclease signature motif containing protein [Candidatus Absconditabacterales bacterium]|nr:HNH endonuclease signature motif containing protein [Candidatus Absconditabacterales bacterium]